MSHDLYASWATAELAKVFLNSPEECFLDGQPDGDFSVFANRESGRNWPIPDGRLSLDLRGRRYEIAIELKRTNEGIHGILTALGQSEAYIHPTKGYSASVIVIPEEYDSHDEPGQYTSNILNHVNSELPIAVYTYKTPNTSTTSPFHKRLTCHRPVGLNLERQVTGDNPLTNQRSNTQWAHLREGSSEPHAFFKYLQTAKGLTIGNLEEPTPTIPDSLLAAVARISPGSDPLKYLSNTVGDILHDYAWRNFWFRYIVTDDVIIPWIKNSRVYVVNNSPTKIIGPDGKNYKMFFSGRRDSIKQILTNELNNGTSSEDDAWDRFATNIRSRAHSYREDIDSGLAHLGFIESDGKPSELGYRYVDICERTNDCFSGTPKYILGAAILKNGSLGALLHYFYKLSESKFGSEPLAFSETTAGGTLRFQNAPYLNWIRDELANNLNVMNTASIRGGTARSAFQGELAILRKFGFVSRFRIGLGLEINWPQVQEYLDFNI